MLLTSTSLTSSPSATPREFLITLQAAIHGPDDRQLPRQEATSQYISPAGKATTNCLNSSIYTINNAGQLSVDDGKVYSTSHGIKSAVFAPSDHIGDISSDWQLLSNSVQWKNENFSNDTASICLDSISHTLMAYFLVPPPESCTSVLLTVGSCQ